MTEKKPVLTMFILTMITIGSVDSIRNLPATALFGSQMLVFFLLGAIFFLLPTALVSAELASGWPMQGGVYIWVREAFGKRAGFLAIWLQWIENVIWYPIILSFIAGTIGYLVNPALTDNPYFLWTIIVVLFWGTTLVNLRGMRISAFFSTICAFSGLILPMILIISLGIIWIVGGNPIHIDLTPHAFIPNWSDPSIWVSLTVIILSLCGIEIATVHAQDVENPQRAFPRALGYSVFIILSSLILGSLAIAVVVPKQEINLVAGIMQAFDLFFGRYSLGWTIPLIALMLVLGGLGNVNNWIIAPTKGLLVAAQDDHFAPWLCYVNKRGAPVTLLIAQAVIVTIIASLFLFMPTVNGSYWLLTALAAQLYMFMYALLLAAGIKLRFTSPEQPRAFRVPGGTLGMIVVAVIGLLGVTVTFCVSFIPPEATHIGSTQLYERLLLGGFFLMCAPPFLIRRITAEND